jgi:DNA segregation ATPase FtsK/SpoIIIE, S-DNA-T family
MARKKKGKKNGNGEEKQGLSPEVSREIVAILLVAVSVLLLLAAFGIGGALPEGLMRGLRLVLGLVAYLLPLVFALLAWRLFKSEQYETKGRHYFGMIMILLGLAGLLHVTSEPQEAMVMAQDGLGGGFVGLGVSRILLAILNQVAATIVLLAFIAIGLVTTANARLGEVWQRFKSLFSRKEQEDLQINEPAGIPVGNSLSVRGRLNVGNKAPKEDEALTVATDADWTPPSIDLLQTVSSKPDAGNVKQNAAVISQTLSSFGIEVSMGEVNVGPTVTQYTLKPESGVKLNKITTLEHNLALSLAAPHLRIEAPIPGKSAVGIEVPNKSSAMVGVKDLLAASEWQNMTSPLGFILGRDVAGSAVTADLARMPHMLIAGATGSGKSVMINVLLTSLLYRNSPSNLKLILVDPKRVELSLYNDIPHLLAPVIVEPEKCISALKWAVAEMERRYKLFAEVGKRNIIEYNSSRPKKKAAAAAVEPAEVPKAGELEFSDEVQAPVGAVEEESAMPYIVIIIDELADLMSLAAQDVEGLIVRLAQMARATGIHLVLATQRPSVDVITGLIKANIPARIAFSVASQFDSRTILDQSGAEKLLGKGDMLFSSPEFIKPKRIQGANVIEKETKAITDYLRKARQPQYNDEILTQQVRLGGGRGGEDFGEPDDDLFQEAADTVIRSGKASASLLQRRLRVGYARAARLLDLLEERGVVGPADGARPRDVLVSSMADVSGGSGGDYPRDE